jgi:acetylornithine/succinyldiaminopimelate/putrescine aminotransferase
VQLAPHVDGYEVIRALRESGVLTRLITNNTLHICPPFVVTASELETAIGSIGEQLATMERIG